MGVGAREGAGAGCGFGGLWLAVASAASSKQKIAHCTLRINVQLSMLVMVETLVISVRRLQRMYDRAGV